MPDLSGPERPAASGAAHSLVILLHGYGADGASLWTERFGSTRPDRASAVLADASGGAFVAGRTQGDLARPLDGDSDAFLGRYDGSGTQLWMLQPGTDGSDSFTVTVTDAGGLSDTDTANISVTDVNVLVSVIADPSQVDEGGTSDVTVTPTTGTPLASSRALV